MWHNTFHSLDYGRSLRSKEQRRWRHLAFSLPPFFVCVCLFVCLLGVEALINNQPVIQCNSFFFCSLVQQLAGTERVKIHCLLSEITRKYLQVWVAAPVWTGQCPLWLLLGEHPPACTRQVRSQSHWRNGGASCHCECYFSASVIGPVL